MLVETRFQAIMKQESWIESTNHFLFCKILAIYHYVRKLFFFYFFSKKTKNLFYSDKITYPDCRRSIDF